METGGEITSQLWVLEVGIYEQSAECSPTTSCSTHPNAGDLFCNLEFGKETGRVIDSASPSKQVLLLQTLNIHLRLAVVSIIMRAQGEEQRQEVSSLGIHLSVC